jgi:hypothetical protein
MMSGLARNSVLNMVLSVALVATTLTQAACVESIDAPKVTHTTQAVLGPEWIALGASWLQDGTIVWAWTRNGYTFAAAAATEAEAAAVLGGTTQGTIYTIGTPAAGGGAAAGGAGGGALVTAGVLIGAVVIAVVAVIAIDYIAHGNFFWDEVNAAGGWGVVLGTAPNPNAAPIPGAVTVSCNPASGDLTTQCRRALRNVITGYYSWFGGSFWTCGDMWASSGSSNLWNQEIAGCNNMVAQCVASTQAVCQANGLVPPPVNNQIAVAAPPVPVAVP